MIRAGTFFKVETETNAVQRPRACGWVHMQVSACVRNVSPAHVARLVLGHARGKRRREEAGRKEGRGEGEQHIDAYGDASRETEEAWEED